MAFYPVLAMVSASYYGLFAIMGGSPVSLMTESIVIAAFVSIAAFGFRRNPGVPAWWPGFCLSYDVAAAGCLAWILNSRLDARPAPFVLK